MEPACSAEITPLPSQTSTICPQLLKQEHTYDKRRHQKNALQCPKTSVVASHCCQKIADNFKMAICPISLVKFVGTISLGLMTVRTSLARVITCLDHTTILLHPDHTTASRSSRHYRIQYANTASNLGRLLQPQQHHAPIPVHPPERLPRLPHPPNHPTEIHRPAPHTRDGLEPISPHRIQPRRPAR
jgi:hypothetical protein